MAPRATETENEHVRKGIQKSAVSHLARKQPANAAIRRTKGIELEDWEADVGEVEVRELKKKR